MMASAAYEGPVRVALWLRLAASPCFACMALVSMHAAPASWCQGMQGGLPVDGMGAMYLLMSLFHLSPWLASMAGRPGTQC